MALSKQAKTLSKGQIDGLLGYLAQTRNPVRNKVILLLGKIKLETVDRKHLIHF